MSTSELGIESFQAETLQGFDLSDVQANQRLKGKSRQFVRFYNKEEIVTKTVLDENGIKTGNKSEPVMRLMVNIITPGDKNEVDDYASDWHKEEFYPQYERFMKGNGGVVGTSLSTVAFIPASVVLELKIKGCVTLEQLADASDILVDRIPQGHMLRDHARAQIKANISNQQSVEMQRIKQELEAMRRQNEALIATQEETEKELKLLASQKAAPVIGSVEEIEATTKKGKK